jgi:hypothetical protein
VTKLGGSKLAPSSGSKRNFSKDSLLYPSVKKNWQVFMPSGINFT